MYIQSFTPSSLIFFLTLKRLGPLTLGEEGKESCFGVYTRLLGRVLNYLWLRDFSVSYDESKELIYGTKCFITVYLQ
jgi:hypothetical protein